MSSGPHRPPSPARLPEQNKVATGSRGQGEATRTVHNGQDKTRRRVGDDRTVPHARSPGLRVDHKSRTRRPDRGWPSGEGTPLPPWTSVHGDHSHPGSGWNPTALGLGLGHDKEGPTSVSGSGPALPQRGRRDGGHNRPSGTGSRARDGAGPAPIQAEPERGRGPEGRVPAPTRERPRNRLRVA